MIKTTVSQVWHGKEVKVQGQRVTGKTGYEIGLVIEGQAKLLAPKDTGYLAASITTQAWDGRGTEPEDPAKYGKVIGGFTALSLTEGKMPEIKKEKRGFSPWEMTIRAPTEYNTVFVGTPLFYGPYQEFGTRRCRAQPFLRPALDLAMGKVLTIGIKNGRWEFKDYLK
jgi:hypothetical protein